MSTPEQDQQLRQEFNRWADAGKGESMEHDHWPITRPVLEMMRIRPTDNILDVGCGGGWLSKILARGVPQGRVVGMDISDEISMPTTRPCGTPRARIFESHPPPQPTSRILSVGRMRIISSTGRVIGQWSCSIDSPLPASAQRLNSSRSC